MGTDGEFGWNLKFERRPLFPIDPMLLLSFLVPAVVVDMQILARCAERLVSEVVSNESQVNLLVSHMRAGRMPQPVRGGLFKLIRARRVFVAAQAQPMRGPLKNSLNDRM